MTDSYNSIALRLMQVTAERDRARATAVSLEQQLARVAALVAPMHVRDVIGGSETVIETHFIKGRDLRAALDPEGER